MSNQQQVEYVALSLRKSGRRAVITTLYCSFLCRTGIAWWSAVEGGLYRRWYYPYDFIAMILSLLLLSNIYVVFV